MSFVRQALRLVSSLQNLDELTKFVDLTLGHIKASVLLLARRHVSVLPIEPH